MVSGWAIDSETVMSVFIPAIRLVHDMRLWKPEEYIASGTVRLCGQEVKLHSFIHSRYLYNASSIQLLLRGAPDTLQILCHSFSQKRHSNFE